MLPLAHVGRGQLRRDRLGQDGRCVAWTLATWAGGRVRVPAAAEAAAPPPRRWERPGHRPSDGAAVRPTGAGGSSSSRSASSSASTVPIGIGSAASTGAGESDGWRSIPSLARSIVVHRRHPLDGPADREVAVGAAVHLAARGVSIARPDELLAHHWPTAGGAARGVQLLDVLAQRHVHATRGGQLAEGRLDGAGSGVSRNAWAGELGERAGIAGHCPHAGRDRAARRPAGAGPRIEDRVAGAGE